MKNEYRVRCSLAVLLLMVWSAFQSRGATEYIQNGGFELGDAGWTIGGTAPFIADNSPGYARSGSWYAKLGKAVNGVEYCYQLITIPSSATSATLSFYYNIRSQDLGSVAHDFFQARIRAPDDVVLATLLQKDNRNRDLGGPTVYHNATFDLLPYTGQDIKVTFETSNDSTALSTFDVDDVSLQVIEAAAAPTPTIQSVFRSGNTINFSWASAVGRSYQVQYKTDLAQVGWNNLGSPITAVSTVTSSSDTIGPDPRRFYRIALLP